jgi:DNA-binding MarR family transcriptional regulator
MSELTVLQAVRLKGRVSPADLAATLGEDPADVATTVEQLTQSGLLAEGKILKITPNGRVRLGELLAAERNRADSAALATAYGDFRAVNAELKALVTDWQLKNGQPNAHENADYDAAVLARLDRVHRRVVPIIAAAAVHLQRLSRYSVKLQAALDKIDAGDTTWLTRPIIDSYHTVWFELHEELILAAGLTREAEAKSGEAQ